MGTVFFPLKPERLFAFIALTVLIGLLPLLLMSEHATTLLWTMALPLLPIFWMVFGYSLWRRVCPLAWFSAAAQRVSRAPRRKVGSWFKRHGYALLFSLLLISFSARHWLLNYHGLALFLFLAAVMAAAFLTGWVYGGKVWCNYVCPVGFVEKVYAGSNAKYRGENSACASCIACKSHCPDIDLESGYWKEQKDREKSAFFYAFPGLVFGFYLYFYLHSGNWESYFSGVWTRHRDITGLLFSDGFFFFPHLPQFLAVLITLLACSALSWGLFAAIESLIVRRRGASDASKTQHRLMIIAGFAAFNIFYVFAGAPTFRLEPLLYEGFLFAVVGVSVWWLAKELPREAHYYPQERFALKLLKKHPETLEGNKSLIETYYTYANVQKDHKKNLQTYTETIAELLQEGVISMDELSVIETMRQQLGITEAEHEKVLKTLTRGEEYLQFGDKSAAAETVLQRRSYTEALRQLLTGQSTLDVSRVKQLQLQFNIADDIHEKIVQRLLHHEESIWQRLEEKGRDLSVFVRVRTQYELDADTESRFLGFMLDEEIAERAEALTPLLHTLYNAEVAARFSQLLKSDKTPETGAYTRCLDRLDPRYRGPFETLFNLLTAPEIRSTEVLDKEQLGQMIRHGSAMLAAAVLHYAVVKGCVISDLETLLKTHGNNRVIREAADALHNPGAKSSPMIERLAFLHAVPIFSQLNTSALLRINDMVSEKHVSPGERIVTQGDPGDNLYILLSGLCRVLVNKSGNATEVASVGRGEVIGEIAIISGGTRTATVEAAEPSTVLMLTGDAFKTILQRYPGVSLDILQVMTARLLKHAAL